MQTFKIAHIRYVCTLQVNRISSIGKVRGKREEKSIVSDFLVER